MQLRQARTKRGSYLLQARRHRSSVRFWPTRIKYIYLMHLQNIDDVRDWLSFWNSHWLCGGKHGMAPEHLTRAPQSLQLSRKPQLWPVCGAFSTPVWHITIDLHWISITATCRFAVCLCLRWRWNAGIKLISNDFVPKLSLLSFAVFFFLSFCCSFWCGY